MSQKETFTLRLLMLTTREIHREIALTQSSSSSRGAPTLASSSLYYSFAAKHKKRDLQRQTTVVLLHQLLREPTHHL